MAMQIRSTPVLEGAAARRFIKEAKSNEKKRGSMKFSQEDIAAFQLMMEKAKRVGTFT